MIVISREAKVQIQNHAWGVYPSHALGFLVGSIQVNEVLAALPCLSCEDKLAQQYQLAHEVAKQFKLEVLGFYQSIDCWHKDAQPSWRPILSNQTDWEFLYQAMCCRGCSNYSFLCNGKPLLLGEQVMISKGKRSAMGFNQKKILKAWAASLQAIQ